MSLMCCYQQTCIGTTLLLPVAIMQQTIFSVRKVEKKLGQIAFLLAQYAQKGGNASYYWSH